MYLCRKTVYVPWKVFFLRCFEYKKVHSSLKILLSVSQVRYSYYYHDDATKVCNSFRSYGPRTFSIHLDTYE